MWNAKLTLSSIIFYKGIYIIMNQNLKLPVTDNSGGLVGELKMLFIGQIGVSNLVIFTKFYHR